MKIKNVHTFNIPVMGVGFTIDTPYKVAPYGVSSVISLVDDTLIEKMRKYYCEKFNFAYIAIEKNYPDARANRITSYLNLLEDISKQKYEDIKNSFNDINSDFHKYLDLLPDWSEMKSEFTKLTDESTPIEDIKDWINKHFSIGSIDVNIMTKLDKENFHNKEQLPKEFNDAHAALKGFAESNLATSIVLSAGLNHSLYNYFENFSDFYPNDKMELKKKIILKVSDYRSALIQGKFLAKKGLWISEYRIESGLNCGGHSFVNSGELLGPVLEEFKAKRIELQEAINKLYVKALEKKGYSVPNKPFEILISAQGGVGNSDEHNFILDYYEMDSVGWGTPFLLVPEVTNVDNYTLNLLENAKEKDLYLSGVSPLGVPFNNLKGNTQDKLKQDLIDKGRPGSHCPKQFAKINKDDKGRQICTASYRFQKNKIDELKNDNLSSETYKYEYDKIVEKTCVCIGLGGSALIANGIDTSDEGETVSICPGPNMAYYNKILSFKEMVDHIYGRTNIIEREDRPNVFIKELQLYIENLKNKIEDYKRYKNTDSKSIEKFKEKINSGIDYYQVLSNNISQKWKFFKEKDLSELLSLKKKLNDISID